MTDETMREINETAVDWPQIDTVLLDMDGTVLDLHFDNHFWLGHVPLRYADRHDISEQEARERLEPLFEESRGSLDWYCLDYWSRTLELDIVGLKEEVSDRIDVLPGALAFLEAVRDSGRQLWLVTNAHPDSVGLKMRHTGVEARFDRIVNAHELGFPKEDDRFWTAMQQAHPFDRQRSLFVDDSIAVLESAKRYGIAEVVAIQRPDSQAPVRDADHFGAFKQVHGIVELMPSC